MLISILCGVFVWGADAFGYYWWEGLIFALCFVFFIFILAISIGFIRESVSGKTIDNEEGEGD